MVRDRISPDTWRILNRLKLGASTAGPLAPRAAGDSPERVARACRHAQRRAGSARGFARHADGLLRPGDGEHDARPGLAVPRHGPAAGALRPHDQPAAQHAGRRSAAAKGRCWRPAGDRRQLDDLPPPLPGQLAGRAGARPAAGRRDQPALAGVPAGRPGRPRDEPAARRRPGPRLARAAAHGVGPAATCGWPTSTAWRCPTTTASATGSTTCWRGWPAICPALSDVLTPPAT